ncbi:EAL domain-containing protein [Candidatus Mycolicibacterium alkanivorans]|uniref:EAL domain-containing protein n=1 Tax=Candidatus Mycolicibacterium alkanivorans TaxID=2954114 RepID=UPI0027E13963|nr:EAL domain-containing protein [Candidatus Mycolicibacterium alkanivorans]
MPRRRGRRPRWPPSTVLQDSRRTGIRVAIDDFGSGYSALSYLHDPPIDEVKLDRTPSSSPSRSTSGPTPWCAPWWACAMRWA